MKKIAVGLLLILTLMVLFTGCGDSVKEDLVSYDAQSKEMQELLTDFQKAAQAVKPETFKKDVTESVLPKAEELKKKLEAMDIKTEEVKELNKIFVDAMDLYISAFSKMVDGIDKGGDNTSITAANESMEKAGMMMDDFSKKFDELAKNHNVEVLE